MLDNSDSSSDSLDLSHDSDLLSDKSSNDSSDSRSLMDRECLSFGPKNLDLVDDLLFDSSESSDLLNKSSNNLLLNRSKRLRSNWLR